MATAEVEIANMALSHLGVGYEIADLDNEESPEAQACRAFFDTVRDDLLRYYPWNFASKEADLALLETTPSAYPDWAYSYDYPSDCLMARRIPSGSRREGEGARIPFRLARSSSGATIILTDQSLARIEYTVRIEDPTEMPSDFVLALSYALAIKIVRRLLKGDMGAMSDLKSEYAIQLQRATSRDALEGEPDLLPESSFITIRQ